MNPSLNEEFPSLQTDNTSCCVYGCNSTRKSDSSLHFHFFPKPNGRKVLVRDKSGTVLSMDRRLVWDKVLLTTNISTKHKRVCSKHFLSSDYCVPMKGTVGAPRQFSSKLKLTAVPSVNLPTRGPGQQMVKRVKDMTNRKRTESGLLAEQEILLPLLPSTNDKDPLELDNGIVPSDHKQGDKAAEVAQINSLQGTQAIKCEPLLLIVLPSDQDVHLISDVKIEPTEYYVE